MLFNLSSSTMLLALVAIAVLLVVAVRMAVPRRSATANYRRKPVLSDWEREAFGTLRTQLPPGLHLCPQVRLADMLTIEAADRSLYFRALNRVASKSVDFVVANVATGEAVLVVELDDKSHRREGRQARDALVNGVLREAGIAFVRFRPSQRLNIGPSLAAALAASSPGAWSAAE